MSSRSRWSTGLQLRRAGLPGSRDLEVPHRHPREEGLQDRARDRRDADGVDGDLGIGQAGDRARLRHRLHPAGVAEAGRRLSRPDHRRRAGPRRGPQLRAGGQRHRGAGAEEDHGAREASGHDPAVAGRRGRAARRARRTSCATGYFKDVDVVLVHARRQQSRASTGATAAATAWSRSNITFQGESAHAAGAPWRGRSALDAVELMNIGWNYRREHLRLQQRSHYVITNGGDQPNVVPADARRSGTYFRETDYERIKELWEIGDTMAQGAAMMTGTTVESRVLGAPGPRTSTSRSPRRCTRTSSGRPAEVERGRSAAGPGGADASSRRPRRASPTRSRRCAAARHARRREARRRVGRHRRHLVERADRVALAFRQTSRPDPGTTGPTRSRWRRRSRTRGRPPAPRFRR